MCFSKICGRVGDGNSFLRGAIPHWPFSLCARCERKTQKHASVRVRGMLAHSDDSQYSEQSEHRFPAPSSQLCQN